PLAVPCLPLAPCPLFPEGASHRLALLFLLLRRGFLRRLLHRRLFGGGLFYRALFRRLGWRREELGDVEFGRILPQLLEPVMLALLGKEEADHGLVRIHDQPATPVADVHTTEPGVRRIQ